METVKQHRTLKGHVISDKMDKTVVVEVRRLKKHSKYKKFFKTRNRYKAHSPENAFHVGDTVTIQESRPLSKDKRWVVIGKVQ